MAGRITIKDISKKVGVSATTVTKALNGKDKISEEMRKTILETAKEMGYEPNRFASALARNEIRLGIVIPREPQVFFADVIEGINAGIKALMDERVSGEFFFLEDTGEAQRAQLQEFLEKGFNGLILSPGLYFKDDVKLAQYISKHSKTPLIYLFNEIEDVTGNGYVRTNGVVAGHIACELLDIKNGGQGGSFGILTADRDVQVHRDCIEGFCAEAALRNMDVVEIADMFDHYEMAYRATKKMVERHQELRGIYITSYNCVPVCEYLKDAQREREIGVVAQDLNEESVKRLAGGELVGLIFQNPFEQGRRAVENMFRYLVENREMGDTLMLPQLVIRSNVQAYVDECMKNQEEIM